MRPGAKLVQATVTGLSAKGLAKLQVETHPRQGLEVWGALPGEQIQIQLGQRRNLWTQEVCSVHPQRREPRCQHNGPCGGCSLQHWQESAQLEWKAGRIYARLRELQPEAELIPPGPSPQPFHYRTKVEFSFLGERLGYHRRGCFDRAVDVEHCWIAPPAHRALLALTGPWQRQHGLSGWNPRRMEGDLRYLMVRQANPGQQWLAVLVTRSGLAPELVEDWRAKICHELDPQGLIWVEQSSTAGAIVPEHEHLLWGKNEIVQPLGHLEFRLGWRSFFQSNPPAYLKLLQTLQSWLQPIPATRMLDLYCGIGSIGLFVCPPQTHLVGVESVAEAIEDARRCSQTLGRDKAEFHVGAVEQWQDWNAEIAILDPPRSGCHPSLLPKLQSQGPQNLFYISCNPERFLSDLEQLKGHYELVRAQAFDLFPQTAHCELLAWLRRKTPAATFGRDAGEPSPPDRQSGPGSPVSDL